MKKEKKNLTNKCPQCPRQVVYDLNNKYRPFCSKSCYSIDLIKWSDEEQSIKGEQASDDDIDRENQKSLNKD